MRREGGERWPGPGQCKKWCGKGSVAPSYIFLMTDGDNEQFFPSPRIWVLCNKQEGRDYAAELESWRAVSHDENYDNVVGVLCCYKARPGPWWNNPMLDNLLVTPVIFIKTGCGSVNWRCWLRGSCECYGRNISWDAAASCLPALLPLSSHLTEPQSWPDSAAANPAICVELTGKGLYCQGWYQCNVRYWYLPCLIHKDEIRAATMLRQVWSLESQFEC